MALETTRNPSRCRLTTTHCGLGRMLTLDLMGDTLGIDPRLPPQWRNLSFRVCWRGRLVAIRIADRTVQATLVRGEAMDLRIAAASRKLTAGATVQVSV